MMSQPQSAAAALPYREGDLIYAQLERWVTGAATGAPLMLYILRVQWSDRELCDVAHLLARVQGTARFMRLYVGSVVVVRNLTRGIRRAKAEALLRRWISCRLEALYAPTGTLAPTDFHQRRPAATSAAVRGPLEK